MAYIKLNKKNFFNNLDIICSHAKDKSKIAIVLKDNAYGHGLKQIATMAKEYGITSAVVKNTNEALIIKEYFNNILILADIKNNTYSHTFHIVINDPQDIECLKPNTNIHIKVDTGMHRNGINIDELKSTIYKAIQHNLNITGVFTHHKSADVLGSEFYWQNIKFNSVKNKLFQICEKLNLSNIKIHSANSAAFFRTQNPNEDLYRIGIAVYGYTMDNFLKNNKNLKPVLSLHAKKISSRDLKKGQKIGYGGTYTCEKDMSVSTYDIGYADGLKRFSDSFINIENNNQILGRISMDNCAINSTKKDICIFKDAKEQALVHNTIEYEILTSLNANIKRIIE
jgi:alanine racemase